MLYLTCTTITGIDLAHYGVSRAKDWVSVDCGTRTALIVVHRRIVCAVAPERNKTKKKKTFSSASFNLMRLPDQCKVGSVTL